MSDTQTACPKIGNSLLWRIPVTQEAAQGANSDANRQTGGKKTPNAKRVGGVNFMWPPIAIDYFV